MQRIMQEWLQRWRKWHGPTRLQLLQRIIDSGEPCNVPVNVDNPEDQIEVSPKEAAILGTVYNHLSLAKQEAWARDNLDDCMIHCIAFVHAQVARGDPCGLLNNLEQLLGE